MKDLGKGNVNANRVFSRIPPEASLSKDAIYNALLSLTRKKYLSEKSKGNFRFLSPASEVRGILEYTRSGDGYVVPDDDSLGEGADVFIPREWLGRGLPGDLVICDATASGNKFKGRILQVLKSGTRRYVGVLEMGDKHVFLVPDRSRLPFDIFVKGNMQNAEDGMKAVVEITGFEAGQKNPFGKLIEILGKPGENDTEMHAIVAEFGFATKFPNNVEAESDAISTEITEEEISKRKDFRDTLTLTIDPEDAKDFDDAISYKVIAENRYEIGVHIADVSHYVRPKTELDKEALNRGTSVYLADRTIPMLPEKLSNNLCSLRPNEDKLAFSAVFEMDGDGKVFSHWFGKTVIHSRRRFSYEDAQARIESGEGDLASELRLLNGIAKKFQEQRRERGAIGFETTETRFRLDPTGKPLEIYVKKRFDAHKLIEEFMLLANREVARFVKQKQKPELPYIYRVHDSPPEDKVAELAKFCALFGYKIDFATEMALRHSLNALLEKIQGKPEETMLQNMAIRSMAKAIYTGQKSSHFGLAFDFYTHFTSPIRRYPDLIAHRLLQHYLHGEKGEHTAAEIEQMAKHSSIMEQKAVDAERASTKYKTAEYLQQHIGDVFEAAISGLTEWGMYAEILENHCEGMIRLADIRGDRYEYFERERVVKGQRSRRTFHLGDVVSVKVKAANPLTRTVDFTLED